MGGECRYEIGQEAYVKLVLHSLKHPSSPVNGLLLGRPLPSSSSPSCVHVADAVPLSHAHIGLLPYVELALTQVEEHFGGQGLSIVGYYHANERFDDNELSGAARKIGDHIFRYFPRAAVLLLNNKNLEALVKSKGKDPILQLYTRDSSKGWRQAGSEESSQLTIKELSANTILLDYISSNKWEEIVDFDDHLDDVSKDWLNGELFK